MDTATSGVTRDPSLSPAEPRKLVPYAHQRLREAILTNRIPADSTISQVQLAKEFGLSRTPLREALRLLEHEGLATVEVNKRVTVADVSPEDLDALYAMRIQQESLAIFTAVRHGDFAHADEVRAHLLAMETAALAKDFDEWSRHHRVFHLSLVRSSSVRLTRSIHQCFDHAERYRRIYLNESDRNWLQSTREHQEIFEAVIGGKATEAAELLARHYAHTAYGVLRAIDEECNPQLVASAVTMALSLRFQG